MAASGNGRRRNPPAVKKTAGRSGGKQRSAAPSEKKKQEQADSELVQVIVLFVLFSVLLLISLCVYDVIGGVFGPGVKAVTTGLFGGLAYVLPPVMVLVLVYLSFFAQNRPARHGVVGFVLFWIFLGVFISFLSVNHPALNGEVELKDTFAGRLGSCADHFYHEGGGVLFGLPSFLLFKLFGNGGGIFVSILLLLFSLLLMAGRGFFDGIREALAAGREERMLRREALADPEEWDEGEEAAYAEEERRRRAAAHRRRVQERREAALKREAEEQRRQEERARVREERRQRKEDEERQRRRTEEQLEDERILHSSSTGKLRFRSDLDDAAIPPSHRLDDLHEITLLAEQEQITDTENGLQTAYAADPGYEANDSLREIRPEEAYTEEVYPEDYAGYDGNYGEAVPENGMQGEAAGTGLVPAGRPAEGNTRLDGSYEEYVGEPIKADAPLKTEEEGIPFVTPQEDTAKEKAAKEKTDTAATKKKEEAGEKASGKEAEKAAEKNGGSTELQKEYILPSTRELLKESSKGRYSNKQDLENTKFLLENTLSSFNVEAHVTGTSQGPSVTRFELELGQGIKVNKIVNLADDLKLKLAAEEIRIEAPIPGKAAVGIEVPNKERIPVSLKELIDSPEFQKASSLLSFVVGKDISGHVIIGDIAKMPHLMVAGTTGSGKSVFTNSIIQSILFRAKPDEVKLILIDPKVVEFSVYNGIPHLLIDVVTDPHEANRALLWAVAEMTRRYKVFADHSVRGIDGFNELVASGQTDEEGNPLERMYQLVIVVDELADLMMVAGKEVESSICRIAQLARAAGIHLVIATQRPSVDVITGLIKANMPSRVALKCGSGIDSRTILDSTGAEKLLGYGDMLYLPQGMNKPLRVQGAYVTDGEVKAVVDFWKKQRVEGGSAEKQRVEEDMQKIPVETAKGSAAGAEEESEAGDDLDEYFEKACRFVVEKEKASSGMLQRIFKVGYNRAARIVDQMEANGVVGPEEGTKPRKVLMNAEQLEDFLRKRKAE